MGDTTGDTGSINALHDICEKHETPLFAIKVDFWMLNGITMLEENTWKNKDKSFRLLRSLSRAQLNALNDENHCEINDSHFEIYLIVRRRIRWRWGKFQVDYSRRRDARRHSWAP